jgi:hypothetical protein
MAYQRDDTGKYRKESEDERDGRVSRGDEDLKAFLKKARDRFKLANDADSDQATREQDDIRFEAGDQWPADIKLARQGQQPTNGMPAVPARPTLVINKVKEPVRQILNSERASDIGIELVPADDFGDLGIRPDDTEVTLREGLVRRIQRESQAADARTWAFKRAVIAGRGFYLVMTRFLPGKTWDQEIYIHRIYNQAGVLLDPSHEQPDGSDADWGFIGTWIPWDRYRAEYGTLADGAENPYADSNETDFVAMKETYPEWYRAEPGEKAVRVVDYWYTDRDAKTLCVMADGAAYWEEEVPDGAEVVDTRTVVQKQIKFCKIGGGVQILEETDWPGQDMPIVKVLGDEVLPYDEKRRAEGVVRPARDAGMGENYMISKFVETVGLAPIPREIVDPDAIDGFESWWAAANTRALPYRPARTYDDQGRAFNPPHVSNVDPNIVSMAQGIAMFDQFIKSTTAVPDSTLGNVDPSLKSGRAIREVVQNAKQSTSNFLDNLARSVRYEGQIINNLLYPIYGTKPQRLVRILTGEGENQTMLVADPEQQGQIDPQLQQRAQKVAKLTKDAHFNVLVKVKKAPEGRRDQFIEMFGQILAADPAQMMVAGDIFYKNLDIPEAKSLAKRQRVMLAPPVQKLLAEEENGQQPLPPQAEAQLAQQGEQLKHADAAIQELQKALDSKQIEQQGKLQEVQMKEQSTVAQKQIDAQLQIQLQQMKDATSIRVAEIAAQSKGLLAFAGHEHEAQALGQSQQHEQDMGEAQRQHDAQMAARQMAHQQASADGQQDFDAQQAEAGRMATAQEGEANRQAAAEQAALSAQQGAAE